MSGLSKKIESMERIPFLDDIDQFSANVFEYLKEVHSFNLTSVYNKDKMEKVINEILDFIEALNFNINITNLKNSLIYLLETPTNRMTEEKKAKMKNLFRNLYGDIINMGKNKQDEFNAIRRTRMELNKTMAGTTEIYELPDDIEEMASAELEGMLKDIFE